MVFHPPIPSWRGQLSLTSSVMLMVASILVAAFNSQVLVDHLQEIGSDRGSFFWSWDVSRGAWSTVGYCNPNPQVDRNWLLVWNMNFMIFHSVGIIPTDELIFCRGVGIPPTSTGNNRNIISHDSILNIHDNQYSNIIGSRY